MDQKKIKIDKEKEKEIRKESQDKSKEREIVLKKAGIRQITRLKYRKKSNTNMPKDTKVGTRRPSSNHNNSRPQKCNST